MKWYNKNKSLMIDIDKISAYDIRYDLKENSSVLYLFIIIDGVEHRLVASLVPDLIELLQGNSTSNKQLLLEKL